MKHQRTGSITAEELRNEACRIHRVYEQRRQGPDSERHTHLALYKRCVVDQREEVLLKAFQRVGIHSLEGLRILDVGCGGGTLLRHLFDFGAQPEDCFGVDLREDVLRIARHLSPNSSFVPATGASLPFPDHSFDIVFQFLVLTSILDPRIKSAVVREILRTLRPGGFFVWYDFRYNNPANKDVRGIGKHEIRKLLQGCQLSFWHATPVPPIGRIAATFSPFLYQAVGQIPWFCSHYVCLARNPSTT